MSSSPDTPLEADLAIAGTILVVLLVLAQAPSYYAVVFKKTGVDHISIVPSLGQLANFVAWTVYAIVGNQPALLRVNVAGLAVACVYIAIYLLYSQGVARATAFKYLLFLIALFAAVQGCIIGLSKTSDDATQALGIFCVVFNVLMFASPLVSMREAVRKMDLAYIPMLLTLAGLGCSVVWGAYGFYKGNWFVWGPNSAGCVLSGIQLAVAAWIWLKTKGAVSGPTAGPGKYAAVVSAAEGERVDDEDLDFDKEKDSARRRSAAGTSLVAGGAVASSDYSPLSSVARGAADAGNNV